MPASLRTPSESCGQSEFSIGCRRMEDRTNQNGNVTDSWMPARLIPVAGIRGQEEQEIRGASSLLAVMTAVDEFGRNLLKEIGAPAGRIKTYTEVPLKAGDGKTL